jgi:uncharacterized membrane protein YidH (DUF202 family)
VKQEPSEAVVDATRRTRLAAERTYLAWWHSALAAFAVSLGVGKVVPELASGESFGTSSSEVDMRYFLGSAR